jgi:putative lipoprotein protein
MRVFKHIKKAASYAAVGGFGAVIAAGLAGCGSDNGGANNNDGSALKEAAQKTGAFVIIEETAPGKYKVLEEYPSSETRVVLKDINGTERVLSKEEMDKLIAEENAKIDAGTSNLTGSNAQNAQLSSGGMSLGETLLASAAGAIIGSWIGNKLFNNPGYQSQRQSAYKNPSAYSRSVDSFNKAKAASSASKPSGGKSGFFGGSSSSSSSSFGG